MARKLQFVRQKELSIYRIVQEVSGNMVKHAGASLVNLSVIAEESGLSIVINDNRKGVNPDQVKASQGTWLKKYLRELA